ncbi:MAG: hypothetical protein MJE68_27650 [Proteobacteria bacterium]|nr:hypothetical protein [Pseudomonadota bacterium]
MEESYQFSESAMQARICAAVLSGSLAVTLPALGIDTRDGTATLGTPTSTQDYIPTPNPNNFTFSMMGPICTTIPIVDDILLEQTIEDFFADLAFAVGSEPDRVTLSPAITTINITDDDCKYRIYSNS